MNAGGGVGIWVRDDIDYENINSPFKEKIIETQTICMPDLEILLINVYRPFLDKRQFLDDLTDHISGLRKKYPNHDIICAGDFNIDLLVQTNYSEELVERMIALGLMQQVTLPTRIGNSTKTLIDHVYTRSKRTLRTDIIDSSLSDHFLTLTRYPRFKKKREKTKVTKRWLKSEHYGTIRDLLGAQSWDSIPKDDVDIAANFLTTKIQEAMDIVAPVQTKTLNRKPINQWATAGLKISIKTENKLYRNYRKNPSSELKCKHIKFKKLLEKLTRICKNDYYKEQISNAGPDTRRLWSIINELIDRKQSKHKMPNKFIIDGTTVRNRTNIASAFNKYFASIGTEMAGTIPAQDGFESYLSKTNAKFKLREMEEEDVMKIMRAQQPKLSCGIDTINNKIVKECCVELTTPMTKIISISIRTGNVPQIYKEARIIPLYKKGAANECGNYRPVSLLSALSKILEKAICQQLMTYLSVEKLLCPDQYGFRPRSQTTHVVHKMLNYITDMALESKVTIATFIDLSKAFDCLQYDKLYAKLESLGIKNKELLWFRNYLTNRRQCVDLEGDISSWIDVKLGVPQGSILGPILFLIYVNDINNSCDNATFVKFADDTTILTNGQTLEEATERMNLAVENVDKWFKANKLNLNPSKTRYMIFNCKTTESNLVKIGNEYIERVGDTSKEKSFKLVGIQIDEKLKWVEHINYIAKKINYANYGLTRIAKTLNMENKKLLYSGLIHSHLVYGLPMWGFAKKGRLNVLLVKQKKAIRKIFNLKYRDHTNEYFLKGDILKLPELVEHTTICYMQTGLFHSPQHISNLWKVRDQEREDLRDRQLQLDYKITSKQWINDLPPISQAKLWNKDIQIKNNEIDYFKQQSKIHFIKRYEATEQEQ